MKLTFEAQRVLGCLIEKQLTTPQGYPLSMNALQTACNQKTNRDPVVGFTPVDVQDGLDDLRDHECTKTFYARGSRTPKYGHLLDDLYGLTTDQVAVLGVLLLRGPQTVGELRLRTERMHAFEELEHVERTLRSLAEHRLEPLAVELPREPGKKENRWAHLLGTGDPLVTDAPQVPITTATAAASVPTSPPATPAPPSAPALEARIAALEADVADLRAQLAELRSPTSAPGPSAATPLPPPG